jgi:predicted TIM-barrel fold metal-dependent hydrolase
MTRPQVAGSTQEARAVAAIDADSHVVETEHTWDFLDIDDKRYRPEVIPVPGKPDQKMWAIRGQKVGFHLPPGEGINVTRDVSGRRVALPDGASADDVETRLRLMDEIGVHTQVCHQTFWIEQVSEDPEVERALCRSWNRWVADIWARGQNRLRWTCVVPSIDLDESIKQADFAKQNGAVGICMRPIEGARFVTDPYFSPLLQAAQDLDLPIVIHVGNANPALLSFLSQLGGGGFGMFRIPMVMAAFGIIMGSMQNRFPLLRWGIIEASASWMPWVATEIQHRRKIGRGEVFDGNVFRQSNVYVTCENHDNIPYLMEQGFGESLLIGTDFGHSDMSSDLDAITKLRTNDQVSPEDCKRILFDNPNALYAP